MDTSANPSNEPEATPATPSADTAANQSPTGATSANNTLADSERIDESVLSDPKFAACLQRLEAKWPKAKLRQPRPVFQRLGRFEIRRELGHGRFGVVFLAWDPQLQRQVALKVPQFDAAMDPDLRERFRGEALSAGKLQHSGIVSIYDVGQHAGIDYLAMAYVDGQTLADRLQAGPLPPQEAAQLLIQLSRAVQHAHDEGVIHRDLKPSNVLLDKAGSPHVTDFGLARRLSESAMRATATGQVLGTPAYMPPEQASGQSDIGATSDVYSLGVILYESITGRPPFQAATFVEAVEFILNRDPLPPSKLNPKLPRELDAITFKCLEKRPAARYQSATELADDLQRYLDNRPIRARSQGWLQHAARWARRHPSQALLSVALLVLVALGVTTSIVYSRLQHADALAAEQRASADTQRYYATVTESRNIISRRQPGWSFAALAQLQNAAATKSTAIDRRELRHQATACLTDFDLRLEGSLTTDMYVGRMVSSPDGELLAVGELKGNANCRVFVYDFATRQPKHHFYIVNDGLGRAFQVGSLNLKDLKKWQDGVRELAFSSDNRYLAVGMRFGGIHIYDLQYPDKASRYIYVGLDREMERIAFSRDGKALFAHAKDGQFLHWADWQKTAKPATPFPKNPRSIAISPFSDELFTVHYEQGSFRMLNQELEQRKLFPHQSPMIRYVESQLATNGNGELLANVSQYGLQVYETFAGRLVGRMQDDTIGGEAISDELLFSRDGQLLAGFHDRGIVRFFDVTRGRQVMRLDLPLHDFQDVALDPERRWLAIANDRALEFWRLSPTPIRQVLSSPSEVITDVAISPNGKSLACVSDVGPRQSPHRATLLTFDCETGQQTARLSSGFENLIWNNEDPRLTWSPDGRDVVVNSISGIEIWRRDDGGKFNCQGSVPLLGPTQRLEYEIALPGPEHKTSAVIERVPLPQNAELTTLKMTPHGESLLLKCKLDPVVKPKDRLCAISISLKIDADHSFAPPLTAQLSIPESKGLHRAPSWCWIDTNNEFQRWTITVSGMTQELGEFGLHFQPTAAVRSFEIERLDFAGLDLLPDREQKLVDIPFFNQIAIDPQGNRLWGCVAEEIRSWSWPLGDASTRWTNFTHSHTGAGNIRVVQPGRKGTLVGTRDGRVHWFDPLTGQSRNSWPCSGIEVLAAALCEDAHLALVASEDGKVREISIPDGKVQGDISADDSAIIALAATPDAKTLVTASSDRKLKLWRRGNISGYDPFVTLPETVAPVRKLQLSPDGKYLAVLYQINNSLELWNLAALQAEFARLGIE